MATSVVSTTALHSPEFFKQRSSNDPSRDLNLAFVRQEMVNRLNAVANAADAAADRVPDRRRDCRTVLHYVDPDKASKEWCADPEANKSEPSCVPPWPPALPPRSPVGSAVADQSAQPPSRLGPCRQGRAGHCRGHPGPRAGNDPRAERTRLGQSQVVHEPGRLSRQCKEQVFLVVLT